MTTENSNDLGNDNLDQSDILDNEIEYKPISVLSIVGFVGSLTSILVFFNPILILLPAIGLILALMGYFQVRRAERPMVGDRLALVAIGIACFVSTTGLTAYIIRENYMYGKAREFSERWFELVKQGDIRRAHQLTIVIVNRVNQDKDEHLDAYYAADYVLIPDPSDPNYKPSKNLEQFKLMDPAFSILRNNSSNQETKLTYIERDYSLYTREGSREIFSLVYDLTPNVHKKDRPMRFKIVVERRYFPGKAGYQWRMADKKYVDGGPPKQIELQNRNK